MLKCYESEFINQDYNEESIELEDTTYLHHLQLMIELLASNCEVALQDGFYITNTVTGKYLQYKKNNTIYLESTEEAYQKIICLYYNK
ncbi:8993_t:CDS:2, partial [Racocetra fulgida]